MWIVPSVKSLKKYGIREFAVPAEMGGRCQWNHHEWLETRKK